MLLNIQSLGQNFKATPNYYKASSDQQPVTKQMNYLSKYNLAKDTVSFGEAQGIEDDRYSEIPVSKEKSIQKEEIASLRYDALSSLRTAKSKYTRITDGKLNIDFNPEELKVSKKMEDGKNVAIFKDTDSDRLMVAVKDPQNSRLSCLYEIAGDGDVFKFCYEVTNKKELEKLQDYVSDILETMDEEK